MIYSRLLVFLLGLLLSGDVNGQDAATLQLILNLEAQINALNLTSQNYQAQINALNAALNAQINKENADFQAASQNINTINGNLGVLNGRVGANEESIATLQNSVGLLEAGLTETTGRVQKLEGVNKIWRSNFQVVNKTFAELRKKFKWVIPVISSPVVG